MTLAHVHLLLNHVPTIGTAIGLTLFILSFFRRNDDVRRVALEVLYVVALLTIPAYLSGVSARETLLNNPDIAQPYVSAHWDVAVMAFVAMLFTGAFSWL